jgi:hypothetical protein
MSEQWEQTALPVGICPVCHSPEKGTPDEEIGPLCPTCWQDVCSPEALAEGRLREHDRALEADQHHYSRDCALCNPGGGA